jgi:hypothetical protein
MLHEKQDLERVAYQFQRVSEQVYSFSVGVNKDSADVLQMVHDRRLRKQVLS